VGGVQVLHTSFAQEQLKCKENTYGTVKFIFNVGTFVIKTKQFGIFLAGE
jgi:hypothetical protein